MAFTLPTFNLSCNIWDGPNPPTGAPRLTSDCNLSMGKRTMPMPTGFSNFSATEGKAILLLPPLTDIRDASCGQTPGGDVVEVPAGSGRFYYVTFVDDFGKGFDNEHRYALLTKACEANFTRFAGVNWPVPIP